MASSNIDPFVVHVQRVKLRSLLLGSEQNVRALLVLVSVGLALLLEYRLSLSKLLKCVEARVFLDLWQDFFHFLFRAALLSLV